MEVLLLDFDGTMTRRDTTRILVFSLLRQRPWRVFLVLAPLIRLALGGREQQVQTAKDRCVGLLLAGLSDAQAEPALQRYRAVVSPLIRETLLELVKDRHAAGQTIVVVTASAEDAVRHAISHLPVQVLGTRFRSHQGRFTGELEGQGCYGTAKVPFIHAWADQQRATAQYVEAWSDSLSDWPMMQLAAKRVWICRESLVARVREKDPEGKVVVVS
ncbi:HAD-IB family phosphatase [Spiribacter salilacus]